MKLSKHMVAIVGGCGYIGSQLSDYFVEIGIEHWVVGRKTEPVNIKQNINNYRNINDGALNAIEGADTVIYAASLTTPETSFNEPNLEGKNIESLISLLKACSGSGVKKFIYMSSGGKIYGEILSPATEVVPINPTCPYSAGKASSELFVKVLCDTFGIESVIFRISNPYGGTQVKKGGQGVISYIAQMAKKNLPITLYGNSIRDYIYISDVLTCISLGVTTPNVSGTFNLSTGVGTSLVSLSEYIKSFYKSSSKVLELERRTFDLPYNVLVPNKAIDIFNWVPKYTVESGLLKYLNNYE